MTIVVLLAGCLFLLASLVARLAGSSGGFGAAGGFLLESFSWAGFFVPVYLLAAVVLLRARSFRRRSALLLIFSILPFLTLSLLFQVLGRSDSTLPQILVDAFGLVPCALLLFLLLALETIFMLTLPARPTARSEGRRIAARPLAIPLIEPLEENIRLAPADVEPEPAPAAPVIVTEPPMDVTEPPMDVTEPPMDVTEPPMATDVEASPAVAEQAVPPVATVEESLPEPEPEAQPAPAPAADESPEPSQVQNELPFPQPSAKPKAYGIPVHDVLKNRGDNDYWVIDEETKRSSKLLTDALKEFDIEAEVTGIRKGPVITLFEVLPAPGVRVSKIANLADNIALRLAAPSVRIVAPIPGRHAVGIEVPNRVRAIVAFKEMVSLDQMQKHAAEIPIALGKDILGEAQVIDLIQTPHLLIGGATNSGKSVLVNTIICSILFRRSPEEVRLFLIDPKIVELKLYNGCPHLLTPVITEPRKAFQALQYCISEMERRYTLLDALGVRDIRAFNKKAKKERVQRLPYIVVVIDEFADLMATTGKELESTLARLAAMARAIGIHMVLATQRPSIDVITGLIKANIPSRIAFMVANKFDSRIIIDTVGAEKLLGRGDMLFSAAWNPFPVRIQGAFVDDEEIDAVTEYVKKMGPPQYIDDEVFFDDEETGEFQGEPGNDPMYNKALEIVIGQGKASASYLQRRLKVGYNRAARLVEEMEERGIVGPAQGSKPREVLHVPSKG
ncbi:MAG TPA: DNA translocase FtsK [Spirochaetia bacterium]|nr:DNA translocase FtsK [Spirochaetia bacterium]